MSATKTAKVTKIEEAKGAVITERAKALLNAVSVMDNIKNVQNLLFMKKGDVYMEYCKHFKGEITYPKLREAITTDLCFAPFQKVERVIVLKSGDKKRKEIIVYPWGEQGIKAKAHSMATSILKTYTTRSIKFAKDETKKEVTIFSKYVDFGKESAHAETTTKTVSKSTITKNYDEKRALAFLDSFLKPVSAPIVKPAKKAA